jgi:predicted RNase H-like HicB family nuclease
MKRYVVIIERGQSSFGAYAPDLPGCGVVGSSEQEVRTLIAEAIQLHIDSLRRHGEPVPEPTSIAELVEAA